MIIRIMNENQYVVPSQYYDDINAIDNEIVKDIAKGNAEDFRKRYLQLISVIRKNGIPVDPHTIKESDLIVPPPDLSFEDAKKIFAREGLIPG